MELFGTTGQERRAWLDRQGQNALDTLSYYLGPGVPVNALAQVADMFNPVSDMQRAGTAAREVVRPGATPSQRIGALGSVATDMASVLAPAAGAAYAKDSARALTEILANWSAPADDAVGRFVGDESGAIRAWHGSPHDFDRFSMDKIGTGEGAQAYGHGLYFAEHPETAQMYQRSLRFPALKGQPAQDLVAQVADDINYYGGNIDAARAAYEDMAKSANPEAMALGQAKLDALAAAQERYKGRLYEVNIDANPEDFLDWDAPLSAQPSGLRAIDQLAQNDDTWTRLTAKTWQQFPPDSGERFVRALSGLAEKGQGRFDSPTNAGATELLREAGIPGIRYLDAGSRGAGDGSRNYVVFSDELISILNKYGVAGAGLGVGAMAYPEQGAQY
jgi:hypothetical protein